MNFSLFNDKAFYKSLFTIAVPIMLQNLVNAFVNMVDTVMIGRLGTTAIASVGLGNQVFFLFNMVLFGICSGGAIFTAQFWGKRDIQGIRKNTGLCLVLSAAVALTFTVLALTIPEKIIGLYSKDREVIRTSALYLRLLAPSYIPFGISFVFVQSLRSTEKVRLPMLTTIIALSINVCLNWFLIFGIGPFPALGVAGAAIATVIARISETVLLVLISYRLKYHIAGPPAEFFAFGRAFVFRFFSIAAPVILNETVWSFGVSAQNAIFARTHTYALAAFNITNTVSQLAWVVFMGLGNGVAVLIGKKIGEGGDAAARDYAKRISLFAPFVAAFVAAALYPVSKIVPFVFNVHGEVLAYVSQMFVILCFSYPFRAFNMTLIVGICRAGGDTVFCLIFETLSLWGYSISLAASAAFIFHAPVWGIYLCVCSEDVFKALFGIARLRSGKWLRNVT